MHRAILCPPRPCQPLHSSVVSSFHHHLEPRKDKQKKRIAPDSAHGKCRANECIYPRITHPNDINHPHVIHPNDTVGANIHAQVSQAKRVGAAPVCPPERPHSGVSIPKYIYASRIMHEDLTMDAPLQGDTGGHTGTAPTNLHHILPRNPTQTK